MIDIAQNVRWSQSAGVSVLRMWCEMCP